MKYAEPIAPDASSNGDVLPDAEPIAPDASSNGDVLPEYGFGTIERYACDFLNIKQLKEIVQMVAERHRRIDKYKNSPEFEKFLRETCRGHQLNLTRISRHDLGTPTVELALLEYKYKEETGSSLLPENRAKVMTSVATAGSADDGEWVVFWKALGKQYDSQVFKTVLGMGRDKHTPGHTARTDHETKAGDVCITYDQEAAPQTWSAVSEDLYSQLVAKSKINEKVHAIFHWGCISHYETRTPDRRHTVEGWARHEHWNMLYCIAMARHALDFLETGGTLVLKVRIFETTETLGLVSLLSCAFENVYIYANPRIQAEFASFVGVGFKGVTDDTVAVVRRLLEQSTSYSARDILCHELANDERYKSTFARASAVREEMRRDHDHVTLVMMNIIYCISREPQCRCEGVEQLLRALNKDEPIIDGKCIPYIIDEIQYIKQTIRPEDKRKLDDFVCNFKLEKLCAAGG